MDLKHVFDALGGSSGYLVAGVAAIVLVVLVGAYRQGRSIEFWPPRVGPREEALAPAAANDDEAVQLFETTQARDFYQAIAPNYDQRNSANLLETHRAVIRLLVGLRDAKPSLRVLDLGGGSGKNVATHFFLDTSMRWTYVDFCPGMAEQFQRHLAGQPLYERTKILVEDINRVRDRIAPRSQDVILLNLVLSSMPEMPDFGRLAGLLAPGGTLIVCDIDPGYTEAHPLYQATSTSGAKVGLRTRAVPPLAVGARADEAGLQLSAMRQVYADRLYSFVAVFVNGTRVRGGITERPAVEAPAS
ncbi:class I SAM-dependent methyltransferase [Nonomuraea sp. NPDC050394]|uniref:class I SAM-dependent methyltransferase n=1 Tax=Nonomuraea sp. NPDC050394 TaxID=3364363 RepID=UPI0037B1A45E